MTGVTIVVALLVIIVRQVLEADVRRTPRPPSVPHLGEGLPAECRNARPTRIADAEPGELIAVYGTVVSEHTLTSPIRQGD